MFPCRASVCWPSLSLPSLPVLPRRLQAANGPRRPLAACGTGGASRRSSWPPSAASAGKPQLAAATCTCCLHLRLAPVTSLVCCGLPPTACGWAAAGRPARGAAPDGLLLWVSSLKQLRATCPCRSEESAAFQQQQHAGTSNGAQAAAAAAAAAASAATAGCPAVAVDSACIALFECRSLERLLSCRHIDFQGGQG